MLDIGWQELFIIAAIAIVVVGPKDLPRALANVTKVIRKARGMARDFQSSIDDVVREAELEDLRKQVESGKDFNIGKEIQKAVDPDGDFGDQFTDLEADLNKSARALEADMDADNAEVQGPPPAAPKEGTDETSPQPTAPEEKAEEKTPAEAGATEPDTAAKPSAG